MELWNHPVPFCENKSNKCCPFIYESGSFFIVLHQFFPFYGNPTGRKHRNLSCCHINLNSPIKSVEMNKCALQSRKLSMKIKKNEREL